MATLHILFIDSNELLGPLDNHDTKSKSLRENPVPVTLQLLGTDLHRNDRC